MQGLDQLVVDHHHAPAPGGGLAMGGDDPSRPDQIGLGGTEDAIGGGDGLGVDQRLAVEAQFHTLAAGGLEAVVVVKVEMNPIDHRQPEGAGGKHAERQGGEHRQPGRRMMGVKVLGQIRGADDQAAETRRRLGDRLGRQDAARRLHHAPDRHFRRRARRDHDRLDQAHRVGALHLGDQNGVGPAQGGGGDVGMEPWGRQSVDPYQHLATAVAAGAQRRHHQTARLVLGVGSDRVLEIEDQTVGGQGARLFQGTGVGARHVKHGAAGTRHGRHHHCLPGWARCGA